jgi:hypothetical protein
MLSSSQLLALACLLSLHQPPNPTTLLPLFSFSSNNKPLRPSCTRLSLCHSHARAFLYVSPVRSFDCSLPDTHDAQDRMHSQDSRELSKKCLCPGVMEVHKDKTARIVIQRMSSPSLLSPIRLPPQLHPSFTLIALNPPPPTHPFLPMHCCQVPLSHVLQHIQRHCNSALHGFATYRLAIYVDTHVSHAPPDSCTCVNTTS